MIWFTHKYSVFHMCGLCKYTNNYIFTLFNKCINYLIQWVWVMYISVSNLTTIGSANGSLPGQHQAVIRTNAEVSFNSIEPSETNFSNILITINAFALIKCIWNYNQQNGGHLSQPQWVNYLWKNMHTVQALFNFVLDFWQWILPIIFWVTSLSIEQSCVCCSYFVLFFS